MKPAQRDHFNDSPDESSSSSSNITAEANVRIATKESRAVWLLRLTVFLVLASVTCAVCISSFVFGQKAQVESFELEFNHVSLQVIDSFKRIFDVRMSVMEDFVGTLVEYADHSGSSFPFVTLPPFNRVAARKAKMMSSISLLFFPKVTEEERKEWEEYSEMNKSWRMEGYAQQRNITIEEVDIPDLVPYLYLQGKDGPVRMDDGESPYWPVWQQYPVTPYPYPNNNMLHTNALGKLVTGIIDDYQEPMIPPSYDFLDDISDNPSQQALYAVMKQYLQVYQTYGIEYHNDTVVTTSAPVVQNGEVKGLVLSTMYWRPFFRNILNSGIEGVIVVLENTCGQSYTYRIDGDEARMLGRGDLHDPSMDHLEAVSDYMPYLPSDVPEKAKNVSCVYRIRVYPSEDFKENYMTKEPLFVSLGLAAVFLFTSAVFMLYDFVSEKRVKIVMNSAEMNGAIVNSLFPQEVRDRMFDEQKTHSLPNRSSVEEHDDTEQHGILANEYPESTVLFADIVGFTNWSSSRTATEVFGLLECIYGAYDKIAKKRKVFKVETVGDCYVATTGLPHTQADHAIIMAKFANECAAKLTDMLHGDLMEKYGEDTAQLGMRFGVHSGPVTAGVLRGEKSRFQIFGDTVNTAARMESNGMPGRIQVSHDTAQLIKDAGKEKWLTPREDRITAKGKGEMQTYWLSINGDTASTLGGYSFRTESDLEVGVTRDEDALGMSSCSIDA